MGCQEKLAFQCSHYFFYTTDLFSEKSIATGKSIAFFFIFPLAALYKALIMQ